MGIDNFDLAILRQVQENNRQTSEEIGAEIGLSATAVQRRLRRLRETGVIAAEVAVVSPAAVGRQLTVLVQVVLERGRVDIVDGFIRDVRAAPEVQQCYYVTGEYDFLLIITAADMAGYEQLVRRLFFGNANIRRFHTSVAIEAVKVGLQVPIPAFAE